jgi:hypothetical protein
MEYPLTNPSQITRSSAVARALDSLLHGRDELPRDTTAQGWDKRHYEEGRDAMKMWYEDIVDIDAVISENVEVPMSPLPTPNLLERLEAAVNAVNTWYAAPVPVYQKRMLHIHYDELAEVEGDLRAGKINAAEAEARFNAIMADLSEIENFSKFFLWG